MRTETKRMLGGGIPASKHDRRVTQKTLRSRLQYLRYCPLCVAENIGAYGEVYWHRKHQLPGSYHCTKHEIRLVDSHVSTKQAAHWFFPASEETKFDVVPAPMDIFDKHKDKSLKIGRESEWLLEHGLSVDWLENGRDKYLMLFRDSKMASIYGTRGYPNMLSDAVNEYWGGDFLEELFLDIKTSPKWFTSIYINQATMSQFMPLQHILLMCVAKGSVEDFVSSEVVRNPFGNPPYICENPICEHYHT